PHGVGGRLDQQSLGQDLDRAPGHVSGGQGAARVVVAGTQPLARRSGNLGDLGERLSQFLDLSHGVNSPLGGRVIPPRTVRLASMPLAHSPENIVKLDRRRTSRSFLVRFSPDVMPLGYDGARSDANRGSWRPLKLAVLWVIGDDPILRR